MTGRPSRRAFLARSTFGTAALGLGGLGPLVLPAGADEKSPARVDVRYLSLGLNALARAHQMGAMAGHSGAAVVAGYLVGARNPGLDKTVYAGIEANLEQIIAGGSVFGGGKELFEPFPKEKPDPTLIDGIAEALARNIGQPRESGHNVIFAAIAIRALKEQPELATPSIVDGIRRLIARFNNSHSGSGNYGKAKGRIYGNKVELPDDDKLPPYANVEAMAAAVIDELLQLTRQVRRQGYGGLVHVNNHAAALADLKRLGYADLSAKGLPAHLRHLRLWRALPNLVEELGPAAPAPHDPHSKEYWESDHVRARKDDSDAALTHRVKTLYGFDELVQLVRDDAKRKQANAKLRFLM